MGQWSWSVTGQQGCCPWMPVSSCCRTGEMTSSSSNHSTILTIPKHFPKADKQWYADGMQLFLQAKEQICWGTQTTWINKNLTCDAKKKQEILFFISEKKLKKEKRVLEVTGHQQKSKTNWEPAWAKPCRRNPGASLLLGTAASKGRKTATTHWGVRDHLGKKKNQAGTNTKENVLLSISIAITKWHTENEDRVMTSAPYSVETKWDHLQIKK